MKISEMSEDDAKQHLYDSYMSAHDAYTNDPEGTEGRHPSKDGSRWREAAAGAAVDEGGLGPVRIQRGGSATDDDQPENTGPGGNSKPAVDGRYEISSDGQPMFTTAKGRVYLGNDALVKHAQASSPSRVRAMENAIPSLRRLK